MKLKIIITVLILFIITAFSSCSNMQISQLNLEEFQKYTESQMVIKAKVINIVSDVTVSEDYYGTVVTTQTVIFTSQILEKGMKGQLLNSRQIIDSQSYKVNIIQKGDTIYLYPSIEEDMPLGDFVEFSRTNQILWFFALFAFVIILFSGFKGVRSLIALVITCLTVFFVFIPILNKGGSPIVSSILTCILITIVTLAIVCGFNRKSISAAVGCLIGIVIAGILAYIMQKTMNMTGLTDEHAIMLSVSHGFSMNGLMFAAVIIGSLGATMDVAVSIASSLEEITNHSEKKIYRYNIVKSGMKIGSDIMGTMTNTLILAYVGSSLPLIILLSLNSAQIGYAISWEMISQEFLRAMAGSIGLIFVVPATSIVTSFLYQKKQKQSLRR